MVWVVVGVWIGAVVLAAVVLGFCAYELSWKQRRLRDDLARLEALQVPVAELQAELAAARARVDAATAVLGAQG